MTGNFFPGPMSELSGLHVTYDAYTSIIVACVYLSKRLLTSVIMFLHMPSVLYRHVCYCQINTSSLKKSSKYDKRIVGLWARFNNLWYDSDNDMDNNLVICEIIQCTMGWRAHNVMRVTEMVYWLNCSGWTLRLKYISRLLSNYAICLECISRNWMTHSISISNMYFKFTFWKCVTLRSSANEYMQMST